MFISDRSHSKQTKDPCLPERLLIDAKLVAFMTGFSVRHIRRMNAAREMPRSLKKGRKILWKLRELEQWVEADMPDLQTWESMKAEGRGVNQLNE